MYWRGISANQNLSEEFIEKFQDKVNWRIISANQKLSEKIIKKFQNRVDWDNISIYQKLSEKFIEEFLDKVYCDAIVRYQKLSEEFIFKHWNILNHDLTISIHRRSLTPAFLCWLYRTYQEEEYYLLKHRFGFKKHAQKIEEEVKIVMIEFEDESF